MVRADRGASAGRAAEFLYRPGLCAGVVRKIRMASRIHSGRRLGAVRHGAAVCTWRLPVEPIRQRLGVPRQAGGCVHPTRRLGRRAWPDASHRPVGLRSGAWVGVAWGSRCGGGGLGRTGSVACGLAGGAADQTLIRRAGSGRRGRRREMEPGLRPRHLPAVHAPDRGGCGEGRSRAESGDLAGNRRSLAARASPQVRQAIMQATGRAPALVGAVDFTAEHRPQINWWRW